MATSNTAGGILEIGNYIFRDSLPESIVVPNTVKVTSQALDYKKVAVMYGEDDAFTTSGYDVFKKALADAGIQTLTTETFKKGDTDFSAQLTKIKSLNPEAIILSALAEEAAGIMVQGRQLGIPEHRPLHRRQRPEHARSLPSSPARPPRVPSRARPGSSRLTARQPGVRQGVSGEVQQPARSVRGPGLHGAYLLGYALQRCRQGRQRLDPRCPDQAEGRRHARSGSSRSTDHPRGRPHADRPGSQGREVRPVQGVTRPSPPTLPRLSMGEAEPHPLRGGAEALLSCWERAGMRVDSHTSSMGSP